MQYLKGRHIEGVEDCAMMAIAYTLAPHAHIIITVLAIISFDIPQVLEQTLKADLTHCMKDW